jgi:hypothetical protein
MTYGTNRQTAGQLLTSCTRVLCSNATKRDRYRHILRFVRFTDQNERDRKDEILTEWKIRNLFEILYRTFSEFYNHSQHVAVNEVIGL